MINGIKKDCTYEHIIYSRIDDEHVKKSYYNENGQKIIMKSLEKENLKKIICMTQLT